MCFGKPPEPKKPAEAPAPPIDDVQAPVINESKSKDDILLSTNRAGTRSFKIPLADRTGSGLAIPTV